MSDRSGRSRAAKRVEPRHGTYRGLGVGGFHDLHYTEWGLRNNPRVIVCAHGYSGNARDFDFIAGELAADARVICIDVAGRGESAWLASPVGYHFGQFVADIHSLFAHLRIKEVDWIGTSMGGLLGLMLASQASSPIRRLVMNDVGAFLPIDALRAISRNLEAPASFATIEEVEAHMRHTHRDWGAISDAQFRHLAIHGSRKDGTGFRLHFDPAITRVARPMPFSAGLFFWDAWYRVRCPVLLLRGEHSEVFPESVANTMLDIKPAARLVEIPGCGHVPALMSVAETGVVRGFLRGVPSQKDEPRKRPDTARAA